MLAKETEKPFSDKDWIFEIKWDGYRAIAECSAKEHLLYSRNGLSFKHKYPSIYHALQSIKTPMVLDGEIVVLDENNKPSFQKLQHYEDNTDLPLIYYVFDILSYKGKKTTTLSLIERKALLQKVLPKNDNFLYCDHVEEKGIEFFKAIQAKDMEGIMAKKKESTYLEGQRTGAWLKIKNQHTEEVVIAGYTAPRGTRNNFGALILGMYKKGKLIYIGHTGTGFNDKLLKELYDKMQPLVTTKSPFDTKVPVNNKVTWVKPKLIANIRFTEWTNDGFMRHPVFLGLRIDKTIKDMNAPIKTPRAKKTATVKQEADDNDNKKDKTIIVDKVELHLTNLNKLYWPDEKFTKGDLIDYYDKIYPYIIPYLKNRPQSLRRNVNGIKDEGFFQKDLKETAPDWANTISLHSDSADKDITYFLCNDKASLLYMANLGCIEINPWNSTIKKLDSPDYLIMDIDPSDKNTFEDVIQISNVIKGILDKIDVNAFCKTSGASGMHIYLPLGGKYSYEECRVFAELLAHTVVDKAPELATIERSLSKRDKKKIYIDYLQNKKGQTLASVYSARPKPGATVSTPLDWKEVKKGLTPQQFTIKNIIKRIEKKGDIFRGVLGKGIDMRKSLKALEAI